MCVWRVGVFTGGGGDVCVEGRVITGGGGDVCVEGRVITGEYKALLTYKIFTSTPSPVPVAIKSEYLGILKSEFCVFIILVLYQFPPFPIMYFSV